MEWEDLMYGKRIIADPDYTVTVACPDCCIYFSHIHYEHNCFPHKQVVF